MKRLVKRALGRVAPEWTAAVQSARGRARAHRLFRQWGLVELNRKLLAALGPVVRGGPFRGMTLTPMTRAEHLGPFLLGTWEAALHPWLTALAGRPFAQIVVVGASFGYYAVGLARLAPGVSTVAFDTDWWARRATREMAVANNTPNVIVAGFCSPRWLDRHLAPASLIVSDCEGYEGDLLTCAAPALDTATILVEAHDAYVPGVAAALRRRFAATHAAAEVVYDPAAVPVPPVDLSFLTPDETRAAVREHRGPQSWLLFTPTGGARP